jgi:hypothetical protein
MVDVVSVSYPPVSLIPWSIQCEFNVGPEMEIDLMDTKVENIPYARILFCPSFLPLFQHSLHIFRSPMAAGGFGPYHRLWSNDALSKRKEVTTTLGGMMYALGFLSYNPGRELLVTPPPHRRVCGVVFFGK